MTRGQALDWVLDYEYGELSPEDAAAFEERLRGDPELQRALEDLRLVRRAAAGMRRAELPPQVYQRLMDAAIRSARQRRWARWTRALRRWPRLPFVLGTVAVLLVAGGVLMRLPDSATPGGAPGIEAEPTPVAPRPAESAPSQQAPTVAKPAPSPAPEAAPAAALLARARDARAAGHLPDALALCRQALAAEPEGQVLADALAEAASIARALSLDDEADAWLQRLERLPGGAERAATIRRQ